MSDKIKHNFQIDESLANKRFDQALAKLAPEYSRSLLKQWINSGEATLNQISVKPSVKVKTGDKIEIFATLAAQGNWQAQAISLNIIYEDDDILVINKPAGLVVHPGAGNPDQTLLNALLHHTPDLDKIPRAGIIHRIDKDTTGLLVIAKTLGAHTFLVAQMQERCIKRIYDAIVVGTFTGGGTIREPIDRHSSNRTKMAVVASGKPAVTHYKIQQRFRAHTHLCVQLETGRTHQIRVHMAHIRHPLIGDKTYAGRPRLPKHAAPELIETLQQFKRQALHARELALTHPVTQQPMSWSCELPKDLTALIAILEADLRCNPS